MSKIYSFNDFNMSLSDLLNHLARNEEDSTGNLDDDRKMIAKEICDLIESPFITFEKLSRIIGLTNDYIAELPPNIHVDTYRNLTALLSKIESIRKTYARPSKLSKFHENYQNDELITRDIEITRNRDLLALLMELSILQKTIETGFYVPKFLMN